jgi:hypothetical protein
VARPGSVISALKAMPGGARPTASPQMPGAPYMGNYSPLVQQIMGDQGQGWGSAYGGFLMRPPMTFTQGAFGPMSPVLPVPVDQPPEGTDRPEPRRFEYEVGWNLPVGQPGSEGMKLAPFSSLKTLSELYSVARTCIQLRKSEIRGLDWDIVPTQSATKAYQGDRDAMRDFGERVAKAKKFFRHPDPEFFSFSSWLDAMLEQVFVYDALTLLIRPTWGKGLGRGVLGTDLDSVELINGATIRPLLDLHGATPRPPAPAYQQYLYGVPRSDYMTMITMRDIEEGGLSNAEYNQYRGDQMMYIPMVKRIDTVYGFPPVERALVPIMTGLQKQAYALDFFKEGCYSSDTEILTRDGWKLFPKLDETDEVATRSPEGKFEWQLPDKRQCFRHDGPMVEFRNRYFDLLVTPNHRMLVRRPESYIRKQPQCEGQDWHIRLADYFAANPQAPWEAPFTSTWEGSGPEEFVLPEYTNHKYTHPEFRMPIKEFCSFLGVFLAEGNISDRTLEGTGRRDVNIEIAQSEGSRYLGEIRQILAATGMNWHYREKWGKFSATSARFGRWLKENCGHGSWNKHVPQWIKDLPVNCLEALLRGMMIGDGNWSAAGNQYYNTCSGQLADDVQEIFQKLGKDAGSYTYPAEKNGERIDHRNWPQHRIGERFDGNGSHRLPPAKLRDYHGDVYCVSVPNKIVYVRNSCSKKAVWCGNTVPAVYMSPGDPNLTPNQIRDLQDALNAFAGDPAWKHKIIVLPAGSKIDPQKPTDLADQFDEVVMTQVAMAFDVNPMELGIVPKVSTVASPFAAREMAQSQKSTHERISTKPTLKYLADIFDTILHRILGQDDMKFVFEGLEQETQANALTDLLVKQVQYGIRSVDEARDQLEMPPWGLPETSGPVVFTPQGPLPFGPVPGLTAPQMQPSGRSTVPVPPARPSPPALPPGRPGPAPGAPQSTITPGHEIASAEASAPSIKPGPQVGRRVSPRNRTRSVEPDMTKAVSAELEALLRHLRKGRDPATWQVQHLPSYVPQVMSNQLERGENPEDVAEALKMIITLSDDDYNWMENVPA